MRFQQGIAMEHLLRSWLRQGTSDHAHADTVKNAAGHGVGFRTSSLPPLKHMLPPLADSRSAIPSCVGTSRDTRLRNPEPSKDSEVKSRNLPAFDLWIRQETPAASG
jgi:hypothetical protein